MQISLNFIIPYIGPINRLETLVFGPNIRHSIEKLEAEMKDGLLHLFIPIAESKKAKTIKIK